jgi:hypothetical protein
MASKAIPRCVPWRVRFLRNGKTEAEIQVVTVSRLFARWLALEQFPQGYGIGMRLSVSRVRESKCPEAVAGCAPISYYYAGRPVRMK